MLSPLYPFKVNQINNIEGGTGNPKPETESAVKKALGFRFRWGYLNW